MKVVIAMAFLSLPVLAWADNPDATQPTTDKSNLTLFNPVPIDSLREMQTDRPNITNTPTTIDAGHVQFENGIVDYAHYNHHVGGSSVHDEDWSLGQVNARVGVLDRLELNAVINSYNILNDNPTINGTRQHSDRGGFGDTTFGGKLNLWGDDITDDAWQTALAIQPQFKFPTARGGTGDGRFEFEVAFPFVMNLPKEFHLAVQTAIFNQRSTADTGYVTGWQNAISIDRSIIDNFDVYIEYANKVTTEDHTQAVQTIDVGGIYQINDNLSVDTGFFFGLNRFTPNVEVTVGFSVRL